jgi:hypothetical protein
MRRNCRGQPFTGQAQILEHLTIENCGAMMKPMIVPGQARGDAALFEAHLSNKDALRLAARLLGNIAPTTITKAARCPPWPVRPEAGPMRSR